MKLLLAIWVICLGIIVWSETVLAEAYGAAGNCSGTFTCTVRSKQAAKFCANAHTAELEKLLRELKELALPGAGPKVREKYRIARKLRKFDDCCARNALRELADENVCENLGEGGLFCVKWAADSSLQELESKKDLKKLTADTSLEEQLKIIKKYGPPPHENEVASHGVKNFLVRQVDSNPNIYVPLLVEFFPHCHELKEIAQRYPQATDTGLKRSIYSPDATIVWNTIQLARTLGKTKMMDLVYNVAFEGVGPLDSSKIYDIEEIQNAALGFFRTFEQDAVAYYRGILYSSYMREKEYVISGIRDLKNWEILAMLKEFSIYLKVHPDAANDLLASRLQRKIDKMERIQQ